MLAAIAWLISLSPGLPIVLAFEGFTMSTLVVGLCLTTTALGTILPIVRDAGLVKSEFGARVLAIGTGLGPAHRPNWRDSGPYRSRCPGPAEYRRLERSDVLVRVDNH